MTLVQNQNKNKKEKTKTMTIKTPKYVAVIFDLDGTLADTLRDLADATNYALEKLQLPTHPLDAYRYFVGSGRMELCRKALPADRQDLLEDCRRLFSEYYTQHCFDYTKLYPGIADMLHRLKQSGLKIAVLSNKPHEFVSQTLELLLPDFQFDLLSGDRPEIPRKPDPTGAIMIAKEFGLQPGKIAYVGDTSIDMDTANRAGMFAIGVSWGFRDRQELIEHHASVIVDTMEELYRAIVG
jgi:phosphoglycolate phosphatase